MIRIAWLATVVLLLWAASSIPLAAQKSSAPKKTSSKTKTPAKKAPAKAGASSKSASKKSSATARRRSRRPTRPAPKQPAPERYAEIQRALAERGYFEGETNGKWDERSVQALKRFQQDQNLKADGKLSSLSLIALGLGPKRSAPAAVTAQPPAPADQTDSESEQPKQPR